MLELFLSMILLFRPTGTADSLYYDVRSTHDTALLRFEVITADRTLSWGLVRVVPQPNSGSATIPGAYLDVETGKVVMPDRESAPAIVKAGSWELITLFQGGKLPAPQGGKYLWTEPLTQKRRLDPEDIYSPFAEGGILLSRLNPEAKDEKQLAPFYLIPRGWENSVQPAYQYFKGHMELSGGQLTRSHVSRLSELLLGDNPVLSVMAFQRLIRSGQLNDSLIRTTLEKSEGHQRAVFTYLLLTSQGSAEKASTLSALKHLVESAKGADELRPVALAAFTAALFDADSKPTQVTTEKLFTALRERSSEVGAGADEYLLAIFKVMRIGSQV